jgi:hypothetical protein
MQDSPVLALATFGNVPQIETCVKVSAILTFLTFTIAKFESSKFQISPKVTEILRTTFEITDNESESQHSASQLNESKVFLTKKILLIL